MSTFEHFHPRRTARVAGILMLLTIAGGVFAQAFVSNRLISFSDAAMTASNIVANRTLFELGFTVYLIEMACQIVSTALLYVLLRPVSRTIALSAAVIELSGCVMKTMSRLFYIAPLFVLTTGAPALSAFNAEQLRALALLLLKINDRGAAMALAFFGVSGVLRGYHSDEFLVELQQRLAAGDHHEPIVLATPELFDRIGECRSRVATTVRSICADKLGVAKLADGGSAILLASTPQVAAGEAAEYGGATGVRPFALDRVEQFFYGVRHTLAWYATGSCSPRSANPFSRRRQASHEPHAAPSLVGS